MTLEERALKIINKINLDEIINKINQRSCCSISDEEIEEFKKEEA